MIVVLEVFGSEAVDKERIEYSVHRVPNKIDSSGSNLDKALFENGAFCNLST
jgi:hypothetical protein